MALIPHDVFNDIIKFSDIKTLWQLYNTDQTIKQLCLNNPFVKVLVEYSRNPYFNLGITSTILDNFLNDLVGNDVEMLKRLQLSFGACLIKGNINKKIIILEGSSNGKSTFLALLRILMGCLYVTGSLHLPTKYYKDVHIVSISEDSQNANVVPILNQLCDEDKFTIYAHNANTLTLQNKPNFNNRLNIFEFKTIYVNRPNGNGKISIPNMLGGVLLADTNTLPALLNFLLEGCREVLTNL